MQRNQGKRYGMQDNRIGLFALLGVLALIVVGGLVAYSMSNQAQMAASDGPAAAKSTTGTASNDPTGANARPKAGDPTGANQPKR